MSFRYYLYISDAKVDMLLPQIDPGFARVRESGLSVGVKVVGATHKTVQPAPDRVSRLERVVRHLREHADVGTIDEPGQFFAGILPVRMVSLDPEQIYFGGGTSRTVVGLGGSARHLLGVATPPGAATAVASSQLPGILLALRRIIAEDGGSPLVPPDDPTTLAQVHLATDLLRGPVQNVEVLAKRLLHGPNPHPDGGTAVLLGSPLYLALVD